MSKTFIAISKIGSYNVRTKGGVYMTTEDKIKELILKRYNSIREFTIENDIPYTTIHSIFRRGIDNSSVANVIKICKALRISVDALADGKIEPLQKRPVRQINEWIEVEDILEDTKEVLTHYGGLTLDGEPITVKSIDSIIDAMDVGVELAKRKNK